MGRLILDGNPPVEVVVRRSARARRLSLRVSRLDGRATLTLPPRVSEGEGFAFVREREPWLRGHLAKLAPEQRVELGAALPFRGTDVPVIAGSGRQVRLGPRGLEVPTDPSKIGPRVAAFLKVSARDMLVDASDRYATQLGRPYGKLTLRDTRSRWGSCSSVGDLMYSWRLIMAPPDVLDYVAAHEVAHLVHMNHSARFWAVVQDLCPDYKSHRTWLRQHGDTLHRVRFD